MPGSASEVEDQAACGDDARLGFWVPLAAPPCAGDCFTITAGCDKTFSTCGKNFPTR